MRTLAIATGFALLAAGMSPALAAAQAAPPAGAKSAAEITRGLEAAGYKNVHDVDWDDGNWEVEATSPAGAAVDLVVDPNGKILHEQAD